MDQLKLKKSFGLKPFADDGGTLLAIGRPSDWKAIVGDIIGLYAECIPDDLGRLFAVVSTDGLLD
jgi:hypothetical protein